MIAFLICLYLLIIVGTAAWIRHNLRAAKRRDWRSDPWGPKDDAKVALTAALAYKAWRDDREGNGLLRTWTGTSAREQERQRRFKLEYRHLHRDDPGWGR